MTAPLSVTFAGVSIPITSANALEVGKYLVKLRLPPNLLIGAQTAQLTVNGVPSNSIVLTITPAQPVLASALGTASGVARTSTHTWVSLYGTKLATSTRTWTNTDFAGDKLPTRLDDVRVTINGKEAPVAFISPSQVNILTPEDDATGNMNVILTNTLGNATTTIARAALTPAFFTFSPEQARYVAAVHTNGSYAAKPGLFGSAVSTTPAKPGETILLFATGLGPTTPALPADSLVASPVPLPNPVSLKIGDATAEASFAGMIASGLYQLNITIPDLPDGDHAITLTIAGQITPTKTLTTLR